MRLEFEKGTIAVHGDYNVPHTKWDDRTGDNRALAYRYRDIKDYLDDSGIEYEDNVLDLITCPVLSSGVDLRPYQRDALDRWLTDRRGVLVLPTGSGKTYIAIKAIEEVNAPAFVVVPTLDLVDQWKEELSNFDIEIGEYTGREKNPQPITVSTYDSAYLNAENLGNRFKLLIFDEVHHLPSEGYRHIAEFFASPFRMGLTATYERDDDLHKELPDLLGGKVYEIETEELAGEYLSDYTVERINVDLNPEEKEKYERNLKVFRNYVISNNIRMTGPEDFQKVVIRSGNDPEAWRAVRARNKARKIAYSSGAKIDELASLLERHRGDRIIIFTRYNDAVYDISKRFFIPPITHETKKKERREILGGFRENEYSAIVSSQVLDEGVDVPDANVGIILSGTGSNREYRQRLGRLLRPSGKEARLYEIVSSGTAEVRTSNRRKKRE
ncbi:MAG: DEAD/DEAH box helicase family protein [Halobacteria archaeon]|nr:DEAD/DEAH box helicase family protein [Halobacteria archaeon]